MRQSHITLWRPLPRLEYTCTNTVIWLVIQRSLFLIETYKSFIETYKFFTETYKSVSNGLPGLCSTTVHSKLVRGLVQMVSTLFRDPQARSRAFGSLNCIETLDSASNYYILVTNQLTVYDPLHLVLTFKCSCFPFSIFVGAVSMSTSWEECVVANKWEFFRGSN